MTLAINKDGIKGLLKTVETAFKRLHKNGKYAPEDLAKTKAYKDLISQTSTIFNGAIADNDIPEAMVKSLKEDTFIFSGLKTNAQLAEASQLLLTDDGKVKSFSAFSKDVESIKANYNENYLEAEYQFAVSSSQSAGNWANISNDYDLQYRTAGDDRVRDSHDKLRDVTLPTDDAFWLSYYPPNGWRCRCTAVQVRKGKYEVSDSNKAIAEGEKATKQIGKDGKNKLEIFRFNPGIQKVVFPPTHPYTKVAGAEKVRKALKNDFAPKNISNYEKKFGVKIDKSFFELLNTETILTEVNLDKRIRAKGAYYHPDKNYVRIPFDERKQRSKWNAESIIYHEFGHAADWQRDLKAKKEVKDLMQKHKTIFAKNKNKEFKELDNKLRNMHYDAQINKDYDRSEKIGAAADTVASLNYNFGYGHDKSYFKISGRSEAEFIAHVFENKFAGNDVFKELMPALYDDMVNLADVLKTK
jgi:SPP1 gp7 family putative phage head morphogenesis protein